MYISPTPNERLVLWRRRKRFSKEQAAQIFETSLKTINKWERGSEYVGLPKVDLCFIRPYERCFLIRKRNEIKIETLALTLNINKVTLGKWEKGLGNWPKLADFYKAAGWKIDNEDYRHYL